jgi:hypothetical protein
MRVEMTPERLQQTMESIERDLQAEMRGKPPYCHWAGESFVLAWPELWSNLQVQIRRFGVVGRYAEDSRAVFLRSHLVQLGGELLPATAVQSKSIR